MTFLSYVKDRGAVVFIGIFCSLSVGGMLGILGVGFDAAVLVSCFVVVCAVGAFVLEFFRRKRFYRELESLVEGLDQAYLISSLLEEPEFLEGRLTQHALEVVSRSAADDVAEYRQQAQAYREYVELWIHEIKTPIAAANLISAGLHGPEAARLKGELDRVESYVEQALFYARSTSLERDYAIREVGLAGVVRDTCKKNARYLIERGVVPYIEVGDDARVFADAKWLAFIIGQIVVNAAKYGATEVRFSVRGDGMDASLSRSVFEIADNGWGIPAADVARVFDRGFTGENGRARGSSTGMGLYLVATMCEKMGLGLSIASEQGVGSRIVMVFPGDRNRFAVQGK